MAVLPVQIDHTGTMHAAVVCFLSLTFLLPAFIKSAMPGVNACGSETKACSMAGGKACCGDSARESCCCTGAKSARQPPQAADVRNTARHPQLLNRCLCRVEPAPAVPGTSSGHLELTDRQALAPAFVTSVDVAALAGATSRREKWQPSGRSAVDIQSRLCIWLT